MNKMKFVSIAVAVIITVLTQCFQYAVADEDKKPPNHKPSPFMLLQEGNVYGKANGMAMICPAHKYGTPQDAMKKLKGILTTWPKDKSASIWVCRANQVATLKMFAPMGDRIFINPFVHSGKYEPKDADIIWSGYNHPCINHIRKIIDASAMKPLIACLNVDGEPNHFKKRKASFEEIKWMMYATIGAGFKGIVWRGNISTLPWANKLRSFECTLSQYTDELGRSKVAKCVEAPPGQPRSTLVSGDILFIILLNPQYCNGWENNTLTLPVEDEHRQGTLTIASPLGKSIKACKTIDNRPIQLRREGEKILLDYEFTGGGICYVVQLENKEKANVGISSKATSKKEVQEKTLKKVVSK